jgi:hypothetical protein
LITDGGRVMDAAQVNYCGSAQKTTFKIALVAY